MHQSCINLGAGLAEVKPGQDGTGGGAIPAAPLPRHVQISEMLIRRIAAGQLPDGTRLPPERELAASLGIAVGTLRRALADLADKGLLERVQGSGNYVRARDAAGAVYALFRLELLAGGGLPTADVISVIRLEKPADGPAFGDALDAHRIRRLRRLDGIAVAVEEIWLDGALAEGLLAGELSESLYQYYRTALGIVITRAEDRVGLSHVPDWAPAGFGQPAGAMVPLVTRLGRDQAGRPVEYSQTWVDHARAVYVARQGQG